MSNDRESDLEYVGRVLNKHGVRFIVIGGQAESLLGSARVTYDVDLCYERSAETIPRLAAALAELQARLRIPGGSLAAPLDTAMLARTEQLTLRCGEIDLDLLAVVDPLGSFATLLPRCTPMRVGEFDVLVMSLDDLITVKRHINRPKDREALYHLEAIKRLRDKSSGEPSG
jgi:predicted nucleotidyltransferase